MRRGAWGAYDAVMDEDALEFLADIAGGDARNALNALELGVLTTERAEDGKIHITLETASECIQKKPCATTGAEIIIMIRSPHLSRA